MIRASSLLLGVFLLGCGSCNHDHEVRWPAAPDVSLRDELAATARSLGLPPPRTYTGERAEVELPEDAPGVRARSAIFEGIWFAEVELGEVEPGTRLPLVIMLHGRGDRPHVPGGPFGRVPTPMRVIVPRGPLALGSGYAWARHSVTQTAHHADIANDLVGISRRLTRLIRHVRRTRPTRGSTIATGFSQGAMVAWTMALRYPDVVGLALPLAGWVPPGARPDPIAPGGPVIRSMHGDEDPIVRIEPTQELVAMLRRVPLDVELVVEEGVAHEVTREMNARFETWLEEALAERAPDLRGGLGVAGEDPEPVETHEEIVDPPDEEAEAQEAPLDVPEDEHEELGPDGEEETPDEDGAREDETLDELVSPDEPGTSDEEPDEHI